MASSVVVDPTLRLEHGKAGETPVIIREEIKGLIRVHVDGSVERHPVVPCVPAESGGDDDDVACSDVTIDEEANLRARLYVPLVSAVGPAIAYFHGGGFCVGSAAWSVYHEFAARLARETGRVVLSVEYRLAPESPLPAAYEDAVRAVEWLLRRGGEGVVLAGDSAGANVVYNILSVVGEAVRGAVKGAVLIQPFFGGEARTSSEAAAGPGGGVLSLAASDAYWRMALPAGASRDHPWCNPLSGGWIPAAVMVCVAELDILRDRNLEFCAALGERAPAVRCEVYEGVGHAFQILGRSQLARKTSEVMMDHIKDFISTC